MSPYGGTKPEDFLLAAVDGIQARLDKMQALVDSLRQTIEHLGHGVPAPLALPEPKQPKRSSWTQAQREAAAARMRAAWKTGKFAKATDTSLPLDSRGKPFTPGARGWTPEAKARLSATMKRAKRRAKRRAQATRTKQV